MDRLAPALRPARSAAGYQIWHELLFLHWSVPAQALQPFLPAPLVLDTFDDRAWLGLVAFRMSGVRPWWSLSVPWLCAFPETNLRTYVQLEGRDPGVWFFSLDASRWLAVQAARWGWGLNYRWARMRVAHQARQVHYTSHRIGAPGSVEIAAELGEPFHQPSDTRPADSAVPGSFEHFLVERYYLYTPLRGQLFRGQVHHRPYPLQTARCLSCRQTLTDQIGVPLSHAPEHVAYSAGVSVEVFPLEKVASR